MRAVKFHSFLFANVPLLHTRFVTASARVDSDGGIAAARDYAFDDCLADFRVAVFTVDGGK